MPSTTTTEISDHSLKNLINAYSFSGAQGTPLTIFVVIAWSKTDEWSEDLYAKRQGQFLARMTRWLRRHGVPPVYLWTAENSKRIGLHTNLTVHVPKSLFREFVSGFSKFIPGFNGNPATIKFVSDNGEGPPKFFFCHNQRIGTLKYFLKGMDHSASFGSPEGRQNLGDALGIQHRGQQGTIIGKRAGVSHSLGLRNRLRSGWQDATSPDALAALLQPVPKAVAA